MKVQLDTKALNLLIGGDSEIELELRNSIVQEFMKKHIKAICCEKQYIALLEELRIEFLKEIKNIVFKMGSVDGIRFERDMKDNIKVWLDFSIEEKIKELVQYECSKIIEESVKKEIENIIPSINNIIKDTLNRSLINELVHKIRSSVSQSLNNILSENN